MPGGLRNARSVLTRASGSGKEKDKQMMKNFK